MAKLDKLSAESWNEIFEKFYNEIHKEVMTNLDEIRKDDSLQSKINPIISQKNSKQYIDKLKTLSQTSSTNSSSNISIIQQKIKKENSCKCLVTNEKSSTHKQLTPVVVVDVVEFIVEDEVTLNYFLDTNNILWKFAIIA